MVCPKCYDSGFVKCYNHYTPRSNCRSCGGTGRVMRNEWINGRGTLTFNMCFNCTNGSVIEKCNKCYTQIGQWLCDCPASKDLMKQIVPYILIGAAIVIVVFAFFNR